MNFVNFGDRLLNSQINLPGFAYGGDEGQVARAKDGMWAYLLRLALMRAR
jgi:hypothetical protein